MKGIRKLNNIEHEHAFLRLLLLFNKSIRSPRECKKLVYSKITRRCKQPNLYNFGCYSSEIFELENVALIKDRSHRIRL